MSLVALSIPLLVLLVINPPSTECTVEIESASKYVANERFIFDHPEGHKADEHAAILNLDSIEVFVPDAGDGRGIVVHRAPWTVIEQANDVSDPLNQFSGVDPPVVVVLKILLAKVLSFCRS